ncbi:uncharacterized protein LOC103972950 isoform X2 [Musa acuminata AAA Group]|uniref:uncharacterized protein LOC103972950 isoform X2 n=1 Tax=Musa acuminata AAA Group TaxID=214697 RepID=UPI00029600E2|nr:PREDICTED: uncharacterized protein LOC103972950 [Musa acuminata subsp. malaccensis]
MEGDEEKSGDFYAVLGLKKEGSMAELKNAYKKLAMKWHPDKCPASGNKIRMDKAKEKFQEIQKAYSVLSDSNKRFLYDVGVYDKDDEEDEEGMGDFIGEIAQMMSQSKPSGSGHESLEELHRQVVEMFLDELDAGDRFSSANQGASSCDGRDDGGGNKRGNWAVDWGKEKLNELGPGTGGFCFGVSRRVHSFDLMIDVVHLIHSDLTLE